MRPIVTHSPRGSSAPSGRTDRLSAARDDDLFAYGSLQFPDVLRVLIGRVPTLVPATVEGWHVTALPDVVYPGLLPGGGPTTGMLLVDLTPDEWGIIDAFENPNYELSRVHVVGGGAAWAYACPPAFAPPSSPWDARTFVERDLGGYLERCAAWLDRFRSRQTAE